MKTRKLALNAVLAAMCAALGALALDLNSIKITREYFRGADLASAKHE